MSTIELISRICARISSLERSDGSGDAVRAEDVCYAMARAKLNEPQRYVICAKYLHDDADCKRLVNMLGPQSYVLLAVTEWRLPLRCPWCSGRGSAVIDGAVVMCDGCHGLGVRRLTAGERCRLLGLSPHLWTHVRPRYEELVERLYRWEDEALSRLIPALRSIS